MSDSEPTPNWQPISFSAVHPRADRRDVGACAAVHTPTVARDGPLSGTLPTRTTQLASCSFASRFLRQVGEHSRQERPSRRLLQANHAILCQLSKQALWELPPIWQFNQN